MNSEMTNTIQPSQQIGDLSIEEAREFLAEIERATQGTPQIELYEFACLVSQIVDLQDSTGGDDVSQFVANSLEEIRTVVSDDQSTSVRMQALRAEAIERWGDQLIPISQIDLEDASSYAADGWDILEDDEPEPEVDVVAPSAEQISSLMSQLGQTPAQASDPAPESGSQANPEPQTAPLPEPPSTPESSSESIKSLDPELREAFLDDATSCVSSMEEALLRLDSHANDADALNQVCRELHTLKGASASVGLSALADRLHALEDGLKDDQAAGRAPDIDSLLKEVDAVRSQITGKDNASDPAPVMPSTDPGQPPSTPESSSESIESLDPELREAFLDDATSCVSSMEEALLRLDSKANDADALNQICRELHTLKGASASVGLSALADRLHALEDGLKDDQAAGRAPDIDSLLKEVDAVRSQITGKNSASPPAPVMPPTDSGQRAATKIASQPSSTVGPLADGPVDDESVRVKSSQLNRLMDMLAELVMLRNRRETELSALQEVYHELIGSASKMRLIANEGNTESLANSSLQLSEIANDVLEVAQHVRDCARPVAEGNTAVSQFIRQFRQELVELRRTPVSGLFRRLQRVVRDAAQAESKEVHLQLIGEDAGIERSLQQRLYEPLLHIVRNSVCHGIEPAEQRTREGKNPVGTITLEANSGPDVFIIEIRDDGRGLDYDAIRRRGVESGLLAADQAASRQELSQLIFQPGFSTRQTASQVAGRGVGMDVVASTLGRMRGWLEVDSEPQQGTRIRLSFPLPSVIQHAMVFRSGGQLFAVPMQSVQSAGEVDKDSVYLTFSGLVGSSQEKTNDSFERIALACRAPEGSARGSARVTLLVDEVVGPEEVVVRPLPTLLRHHPFCSGATLSGMGETVLFLDARRVVESQSHDLHRSASPRRSKSSSVTAGSSLAARPRVLVVDDSVSARKVVVRSLQRYPVDIVEACDGKEALGILKTQQLTAVFSDMEMPHVSGMELLAEVNSLDRSYELPVVIISSRGEDEYTSRAKELGAVKYLIKPLADDALDAALAAIPSLRHLTTNAPTT